MQKLSLLILIISSQSLFAQMPATLSPSEKVYGLSRFWQEVNYNFVYLDRIDRQKWDSLYIALIGQVQKTPDDYTYYRLLQKFCATLHDGHTNVWMPPGINNSILTKMFGEYWLGTENIDGKAIVTHTLKTKIKEIPIGSEIIEVNGLPTDRYIADSVRPYISSSTAYVLEDNAISGLLSGPIGASYKVKIRRPDGSILPLQLTHERSKDTSYYPALVNTPLLELKWYDKDIAYLALNSFGDEKIDTLFLEKLPGLYQARALIIDLRANGGGSTGTGTAILQYLTQDSIMQHSRYFTRQHMPAFKAWGKFVNLKDTIGNDWARRSWLYNHDAMFYTFDYAPDTIHLGAKRLVVPTVLLIGHNTASAAEDFLISAANQKHMVRIGDRSFGSTGQPFLFDLPGGGGARICTKKDTYPDGKEFVGYGVAPDIFVRPTVKDFIDHKDPVLERGLEYLRQQRSHATAP
ncbi:S41 family peptidase [Flavitalea sp. BT771]|uniref:S41 family peptidase n=1 Tax=Flavitalea sp. BT771 TaxID=3063329 RepID=UPI0026E257AB|nr:S41 family peptidase [Flavitalea sp. BT771]MDO6429930.1 S41 family peptidase [Flavitalea sp. BT771]MDV6217942.1 S41 family peptidase [Flavitalea sp. BT771]